MDLNTAINHPLINVFDIWNDKKSNYGFSIYTYRKPGETDDEWHERDTRNFELALRLKNKSRGV